MNPTTVAQLQLVTPRQICGLLCISRQSLERLRQAGKMPPAIRVGKRLRWRMREIRCWIEGGCK